MTYKAKSAVYALNSYTWKLLQANLGWTAYKGVPRIIPTAQQPEFLQSAESFIVYGSAFHPATELYALDTEAISYNVFGKTVTETNNIAQLLYEVYKRQDDAAADVNKWLEIEETSTTDHTLRNRGITFGSIRSVMVEKAEPADEEGGYVSALVLIETKYTALPSEITTRFNTV